MPPKKSRGEAAKERNKIKRKAKFQAAEAAKDPEDRILTRTDLEDMGRQFASENQLYQIKQTIQWFKEFWLEGLDQPLGTEEEVDRFFKDGSLIRIRKSSLKIPVTMDTRLECRFGHAPSYPRFGSYGDLLTHWADKHNFSPGKDPNNYLHFWCSTCEDYVFLRKGSTASEEHCASHLASLNIIKRFSSSQATTSQIVLYEDHIKRSYNIFHDINMWLLSLQL